MDIKIPLAREEEVGQSVLLASTGNRAAIKGSIRGGKRTKISGNVKGGKDSQTISAAQASKGNAKDKGRNGRKGRRGRSYSLRSAVGDAERRNPAPGRSAKELGIEWLDARCEDSPVTKAHHFIARTKVDTGCMWECKYCHKIKWMPLSYVECLELDKYMHIYGLSGGYQRILDCHPAARRLLSKIQDIYYLRKFIPPEQFPIAVAAVMLDREYPYDVTIEEEDIL